MDLCWSCKTSEYHNYKDIHGIRCPRCGQKEKDDPAKVVEIRLPAKKAAATKRTPRSK